MTKQGVAAIVATRGNEDCHVILRGGTSGQNYSAEAVAGVSRALAEVELPQRVMVDCSHANSGKDPARQPEVVEDLSRQIAGGNKALFGVMLESFLEEGRQDHTAGGKLRYGLSITDACMGWERTRPVLAMLAEAVRKRRN